MALYKICGDGWQNTETKEAIPNAPGNRQCQEVQEWIAQGNTPDPEFTQEEIDEAALEDRQNQRLAKLAGAIVDNFDMLLELFQVGVTNGLWTAQDFPPALRQKAQEWRQLIEDYRNRI